MLNDFPAVVRVFPVLVDSKYVFPEKLTLMEAIHFKEPYTFRVFDDGPAKTGAFKAPVQSILLQEAEAGSMVMVLLEKVNPEFASKNTSSLGVGARR